MAGATDHRAGENSGAVTDPRDLRDRRVLVAGGRVSGRALLPTLGTLGARVTVADSDESALAACADLGADTVLMDRIAPDRAQALERLDRLRQTLGHTETLRRGFAVIRGPEGQVVTSAVPAATLARVTIEFHDGQVLARPEQPGEATAPGGPAKGRGKGGGSASGAQKSLF